MIRRNSLRAVWLLTFAASAALMGSGASACLPPPPGPVEPTLEERVESVGRSADNIVYGKVVRGNNNGRPTVRFKVLRVYRGALRPGAVIELEPGYGLHGPPCLLFASPPHSRGERGIVFFFAGTPRLNFLAQGHFETMVRNGWVVLPPSELGRRERRRRRR